MDHGSCNSKVMKLRVLNLILLYFLPMGTSTGVIPSLTKNNI